MELRSRTLSQGPEIQRVQQAVAPIVAHQPLQPTTPPAATQGQGQVIFVPASTVARNGSVRSDPSNVAWTELGRQTPFNTQASGHRGGLGPASPVRSNLFAEAQVPQAQQQMAYPHQELPKWRLIFSILITWVMWFWRLLPENNLGYDGILGGFFFIITFFVVYAGRQTIWNQVTSFLSWAIIGPIQALLNLTKDPWVTLGPVTQCLCHVQATTRQALDLRLDNGLPSLAGLPYYTLMEANRLQPSQ